MTRDERLHRLAAAVRWLAQVDADLLADDIAEAVVLELGDLHDTDRRLLAKTARVAATLTLARVTEATGNAMAGAWPTPR